MKHGCSSGFSRLKVYSFAKTVECSQGVMLGKYFAADTKCDSHTEARGLSTEDNPPESGGETDIE